MRKEVKMNEIRVVLVYLTNGVEKVVNVDFIENFNPKSKSDFKKNCKYKIWWQGTRDKNDYSYNGYSLLIGCKYDLLKLFTKIFLLSINYRHFHN